MAENVNPWLEMLSLTSQISMLEGMKAVTSRIRQATELTKSLHDEVRTHDSLDYFESGALDKLLDAEIALGIACDKLRGCLLE